MFRFAFQIGDRHLMRAPCSFDRLAVDKFRPSPAFWSAQNNHWPGRQLGGSAGASLELNDADFLDNVIKSASHQLVHGLGIIALHKVRFVSMSSEQVS